MFEILHPTLLQVTVPPAELCQGEVDNLLVHLCWHGTSNTSRFRCCCRWCYRCCYIRLGHTVCYTTSFINWRSHTVIFRRQHTSQWPPQHTPQWPSNLFQLNTISSSDLGSVQETPTLALTGCAARWPGWPRWPLWLAYWRLGTVIELFFKLVQ